MSIPDTARSTSRPLDGPSLAALLAAGIGAAALGVIVLLDATDVFSAPGIYAPAGGVSGRTTIAVVVWLIAWIVLHHRWKRAAPAGPAARRVAWTTAALVAFGLVATFPPVWGMF